MEASQIVGVYIGYIIGIYSLLLLFIIYFKERKNIITDLRGKDLIWQLRELSAIGWLILFPSLAVCDMLGYKADSQVWWSLDLCYMANLGSKNLDHFIDKKYGSVKDTQHEDK